MGSDLHHCNLSEVPQQFQSPLPSGERLYCHIFKPFKLVISIPAPQWGATNYNHIGLISINISIPAPQWGATRSCGVDHYALVISIPAPQWGATEPVQIVDIASGISIPAPQWGATSGGSLVSEGQFYFNPRSPVGSDLAISRSSILFWISIPAPQWGATCIIWYCTSGGRFQSPLPSGERLLMLIISSLFQ